jgi:hypothetical protein
MVHSVNKGFSRHRNVNAGGVIALESVVLFQCKHCKAVINCTVAHHTAIKVNRFVAENSV